MMIKNTILALLLIAPPLTATAAKGDAQSGKEKAQVCAACHGTDGRSVDPSYPNLAGQHASYLQKSLGDYRAGRRTNVIMAGMAAPLTDQDILDLSAWYSSQDGLQDIKIK